MQLFHMLHWLSINLKPPTARIAGLVLDKITQEDRIPQIVPIHAHYKSSHSEFKILN